MMVVLMVLLVLLVVMVLMVLAMIRQRRSWRRVLVGGVLVGGGPAMGWCWWVVDGVVGGGAYLGVVVLIEWRRWLRWPDIATTVVDVALVLL